MDNQQTVWGKTFFSPVSYHPASNDLVERANRKILEVLRSVVYELLETWEDWLLQVSGSIIAVFVSLRDNPLSSTFLEIKKRLPYESLSSSHTPVYKVNDYVKYQIKVFSDTHKSVKDKLQSTNTAICNKQHKRAFPVSLEVGDSVIRVPE